MVRRQPWPLGPAAIMTGIAGLLLAGGSAGVRAAQETPSVQTVVSAAQAEARAGGKVVLIEFGASWCTWCRSFKSFVQAPTTSRVVADNYVVVNLTVAEHDADKKRLENPGGGEALARWGGANAGLPFYVFLDTTGRKLADSNAMPDGTNIGYPVSPVEIERFVGLLDRTAPHLTSAGRSALLAYLEQAARKQTTTSAVAAPGH